MIPPMKTSRVSLFIVILGFWASVPDDLGLRPQGSLRRLARCGMWIGGDFLPVLAAMAISSEERKYFEEMGELYVRRAMQMTDRFPFLFENSAREWLA
jgi:hypothetical protein